MTTAATVKPLAGERTQIQDVLSQVRAILPPEWSASEAIGVSFGASSIHHSPEFVMVTRQYPKAINYGCRSKNDAERATAKEARKAWRAETTAQGATIAEQIKAAIPGVRVRQDSTQLDVILC